MSEKKFIFAYDPQIRRKVLHTVKNQRATSIITGNTFKYSPYKKARD